MSIARTRSIALNGMQGAVVEIEADISSALPKVIIIGLPDSALSEAQHRVRAAAANSGCELTDRRLTINLSPAALPKHGSGFDLGIAVAALAAAGDIDAESVERVVHLGELGLDGRLRPIDGILPATHAAQCAGAAAIMVPAGNTEEASLVPGIRVIGIASLRDAAIWHGGEFDPVPVEAIERRAPEAPTSEEVLDLADVIGNDAAVEAMLVAVWWGASSGVIRPGAAARASHGVLFLDEAPEFPRAVLDALRQPLESGVITIHRANAVARFPGAFQLVLAANPCPCGQYGVRDADCTCPPSARRRYLDRLSGPLLDRIDLQLHVTRVTAAQVRIASENGRTTTADARARVSAARELAAVRLRETPWSVNSQVPGAWLRGRHIRLPSTTTSGLDRALERGGLTMRGYDRVLRVAWTIADLEATDRPSADHVGRALYLRKAISA
jgi:magnesium chelatase family protein